ncbi:hypothetical protein CPC08DRAFT_72606 [Agrocybe pediades]|nr:hypothetical protein CPC08DRAFT_72606 [Agrocybe pediades]
MSPSNHVQAPLRTARLISLILAWCFAVMASSFGLNALIKSNQEKSKLKKLAPPPTVLNIDTSDIFNAGVVATVASLLIAVIISKMVIAPFLPWTRGLAARTLGTQSLILFLCALFLLGSQIGYIVYYVNREAKVTAFIGPTQLPDAVVRSVEKASGSTRIYKDIQYLKYCAYFPWFALLFTLIAASILFIASRKYKAGAANANRASQQPVMSEKEDVSHIESRNEKTSV